MKILDARFMVLQYLLNAYDKINIPLIGFDGNSFLPMSGTSQVWTGCFDDIGIYVLIPKLVTLFNLSLQQGIDIFFYGLQYIPFFLAIIGFYVLYTSWIFRVIAVCSLGLLLCTIIKVPITDVYLAYCAAPLSVIPLFMYFLQYRSFGVLSLFVFFCGIFLELLHYIRSYSSLPVIGFLIIILLTNNFYDWQRKCIITCVLLVSLSIPYSYFSYLVHQYKTYAVEHFKDCDVTNKHAFWTTLYAGFGFLKYLNIDNISFEDSCVIAKVQETYPNLSFLQMSDFENEVKQKIIDLLINQHFFVIATLFAKLGVLFFFLLKYAHVGLLALFFVRKIWWQEIAWLCCLGLSSLFPLMTLPQGNYTLSFIACSTLMGITYAGRFFECYNDYSLWNIFSKKNLSAQVS